MALKLNYIVGVNRNIAIDRLENAGYTVMKKASAIEPVENGNKEYIWNPSSPSQYSHFIMDGYRAIGAIRPRGIDVFGNESIPFDGWIDHAELDLAVNSNGEDLEEFRNLDKDLQITYLIIHEKSA